MPPAFVSLVRAFHPFPSLIVTAVTLGMGFMADSRPPASTVAVLGVGMLAYQFCIGLANDVIDATDDARTKPWKAIPRGVLSRRAAVLMAAGLAGAGVLVTSTLDLGPWLIGVAGLACGLAYDVQLKRTTWSWLPFAVAFPLIPVWAFTALDRWEPLLWWVFPLGALLGLALHLANQAADVPAEAHIRGFAHRLGTERSANLALGLVGLAGMIAVVVLLIAGDGTQAILSAGTVMVAGVLAKRAVRIFGADGLFGLLASSSAILAVAFTSAAR